MSERPLLLSNFGLITGVGLHTRSTCAAIRCAVDNFKETHFMDLGGERILGSEVPLPQPWRGQTKLVKMAVQALSETLQQAPHIVPDKTPLLLCISDPGRPGRVIKDYDGLLSGLCREFGATFHPESRVIPMGQVSIATALQEARGLMNSQIAREVLVVATDSLLVAQTLTAYEAADRLLTSQNANGFMPGEGAGAFTVTREQEDQSARLVCLGLGFGMETATVDSDEPLRGDGLVAAIEGALGEAGRGESILDFKITDLAGEHYYFKEASLAFSRLDRTKRETFDVWHPADCVGNIGVALGVVMLAVLYLSGEKRYARGSHALMHLGNDDGRRCSLILHLPQIA